MTLPERGVAWNWVGRTVIDRDRGEIGVCRAMLTDDGTGLPEWLYVEVDETTVIVPLVGATEVGEHVQVAVSRGDARSAPPPVGDKQHLSQGEEAALYQHYGIEYSRDASETLLPAGDVEPPGSTEGPPESPPAEASSSGVASDSLPEAGDDRADTTDTTDGARGGRRAGRTVAVLAGLGVIVAAALRLRRRPQPLRKRAGRRAARSTAKQARAASLAAKAQAGRIASSVVPVAAATGRVIGRATSAGAVSALHAGQATSRFAAAAIPRVAARGIDVGQTGLRAALKVGGAIEAVPEAVSTSSSRLQKGWKRVMGKLSLGLGLAVGYVIGARAGRARFEQIKDAAGSLAERPEVQQGLEKLRTAVPPQLQKTVENLSHRTSSSRPAGSSDAGVAGTPASSSSSSGTVGALPTDALKPPDPFVPPGQSDGSGSRP